MSSVDKDIALRVPLRLLRETVQRGEFREAAEGAIARFEGETHPFQVFN